MENFGKVSGFTRFLFIDCDLRGRRCQVLISTTEANESRTSKWMLRFVVRFILEEF